MDQGLDQQFIKQPWYAITGRDRRDAKKIAIPPRGGGRHLEESFLDSLSMDI